MLRGSLGYFGKQAAVLRGGQDRVGRAPGAARAEAPTLLDQSEAAGNGEGPRVRSPHHPGRGHTSDARRHPHPLHPPAAPRSSLGLRPGECGGDAPGHGRHWGIHLWREQPDSQRSAHMAGRPGLRADWTPRPLRPFPPWKHLLDGSFQIHARKQYS